MLICHETNALHIMFYINVRLGSISWRPAVTVSTLYKLTAQLLKWLSALSLVFQLNAGLEAEAGISYGFL